MELQEWQDCIKSNKTRTVAIIILVLDRNPQGYNEQFIKFIDFYFGIYVAINHWLENIKQYMCLILKNHIEKKFIRNMGNSGTAYSL